MLEHIALISLALPVATLLGTALIGWIADRIVVNRLRYFARRGSWSGSERIVRIVRFMPFWWGLLLGINLALPLVPFTINANWLVAIHQILTVLFVLSLTLLAARAFTTTIQHTTRPDARPAVSLITTVVSATIYLIGFLIILSIYQVNVSPGLAALGVTGLAVSLALQATLTDLISGVQLIAVRQIRPGHYIRLSSGEEGYVTDIGWRTTQIRELANNIIIVPNAKMTSAIVTNYSEPVAGLAVLMDIGVSLESDLEQVERVTVEVATQVMQSVQGGIPESEPFIRYSKFDAFSVRFTIIMQGAEYTDQYLIKHEFIKALQRRYREEGIVIPYPIQSVRLQDGATITPSPHHLVPVFAEPVEHDEDHAHE